MQWAEKHDIKPIEWAHHINILEEINEFPTVVRE
jgi:hypothetical protein